MRIREDMLHQPVAAVPFRIREPVERAILLWVVKQVTKVALFFVAEGFTISDKKLKVACVGFVHMRIINLINGAVAQREP